MEVKKFAFGKKPVQSASLKKSVAVYTLPSVPTEPSKNLWDYSWCIYGPKKIGKTTLASQFPSVLFLMFEPGAKALRLFRTDINKWEDAEGYMKELEKEKGRFKTLVMDTAFEAYAKCSTAVCQDLKIDYPREDNFGKDWNKIKTRFREFGDRAFSLDMGLCLLCHETVKENTTYTGSKYDQIVPNMQKGLDEYFRAKIENVMWYHYRGKERFLQIRGSDAAMAGLALQADEFFKTPAGEPIFAIPISENPKKGMEAIITAFNNKQQKSFRDETEKMSTSYVNRSVNEHIKKESRKSKRF